MKAPLYYNFNFVFLSLIMGSISSDHTCIHQTRSLSAEIKPNTSGQAFIHVVNKLAPFPRLSKPLYLEAKLKVS